MNQGRLQIAYAVELSNGSVNILHFYVVERADDFME